MVSSGGSVSPGGHFLRIFSEGDPDPRQKGGIFLIFSKNNNLWRTLEIESLK